MNTLTEAATAVRMMESRGNYNAQQKVRVGGQSDSKVGAYGILESRWGGLAASLGYEGANWRDRKMQDVIANEKLSRDYKRLGSWEMAAVAFRYGYPVAKHLMDSGATTPAKIKGAGYDQIGEYLRDMKAVTPNPQRPVTGRLRSIGEPATGKSSTLTRSEGIVRNQIVQMRNAQKRSGQEVPDGGNEVEQS